MVPLVSWNSFQFVAKLSIFIRLNKMKQFPLAGSIIYKS